MSTPTTPAQVTVPPTASCGELSCDECNARTAALVARADRAEAQLAAERARLDWLNLRAPKCWSLIDAQMLAGKTETICAAIDAAMKEGAK